VPPSEPLIRERLWVHDLELAPGVTARTELDDAGRIFTIDEPDELRDAFEPGWREETGGRLRVEHDGEGPLRILGPDDELVWERADEPWPELRLAFGRLAWRGRADMASLTGTWL
jgi:hypothetical protein